MLRLPTESEWLLTEPVLAQVDEIRKGDPVALERLVARLEAAGPSRSRGNGPGYQVTDGVAVMSLSGLVSRTPTLLGLFFEEIVTNEAAGVLRAAAADESASEILLAIDSPGGSVNGTPELAAIVAEVNAKKPVTVWVEGVCCSAAYWIACNASAIHAAPSALLGSIGALYSVTDSSRAAENEGFKRVVLRSGSLKGGEVPGAPVPPAYLADRQQMVDAVGAAFLAEVKARRGLTDDQAAKLKEGSTYLAPEAKTLGLIDGVTSLGAVVNRLVTRHQIRNSNPSPYAASDNQEEQEMPNIRQRLGLAATATEDDIEHAIKVLEDKANAKPESKAKTEQVDIEALASKINALDVDGLMKKLSAFEGLSAKVASFEAAEKERQIKASVEHAIAVAGVIPVGAREEALKAAAAAPAEFAALVAKLPQVTPTKRRFQPSAEDSKVDSTASIDDQNLNTSEGREALASQAEALMAKDPKLTFEVAVDKVLGASGVN